MPRIQLSADRIDSDNRKRDPRPRQPQSCASTPTNSSAARDESRFFPWRRAESCARQGPGEKVRVSWSGGSEGC
jgi:hypothetical protein